MVFDASKRRFFEFGEREPGRLQKPLGLATDGDCNVYVADGTTRRILIFNQDGGFLKSLGGQKWFERLSHVIASPSAAYVSIRCSFCIRM